MGALDTKVEDMAYSEQINSELARIERLKDNLEATIVVKERVVEIDDHGLGDWAGAGWTHLGGDGSSPVYYPDPTVTEISPEIREPNMPAREKAKSVVAQMRKTTDQI